MNKEDCIEFDSCIEAHRKSGLEDLDCQDCDHYVPDSCWEDFDGKKPFWVLVRKK